MSVTENYIVDSKGKKIAVMLKLNEYKKLRQMAEELEDIHIYDKAKQRNEALIPLREAIKLRKKRNASV